MLIPFKDLYNNYKLKLTGILHLGAHECEELTDYEMVISRDKILWVEAIPEKVNFCKNNFKDLKIEQAVISDNNEEVEFKISNNGQSSSFLDLGTHVKLYPYIYYINSFKTKTKRMDEILNKYEDINFNFINLDLQGVELKALKGMESYLKNIDYIYTEVNKDYVYKNCTLIDELDEYLSKFNFKRVQTELFNNNDWSNEYNKTWGDAFYIKER